jgi:nucleoside-diphosphate-sugar epimerase
MITQKSSEVSMKVLFIGGTGIISTAVSRKAVEAGIELYLLNRGQHEGSSRGLSPRGAPDGAHHLEADIHQPESVRAALRGHSFDAVVDWIAYTPADIERDLELFTGRTRQFIFISSASVYQKPPTTPFITESTPLYNPHWKYSQDKIACEELLNQAYRQANFPITIVRPSLTYNTIFPIAIGGWGCYTLADRLLKGRPIIIHGDGSSLWTVTHAEDFGRGFLGLVGNPLAVGHAFHITSDEVLTWNQIYTTIAAALGVEAQIVYMPSDFIARHNPALGASLLGDKTWSGIFDNTKIKAFVPGYQARIPFREGVGGILAWFDADPRRKRVDPAVNAEMDSLIAAYKG